MNKVLTLAAAILVIIIIIMVALIALDVYTVPFVTYDLFGVSYPAIHWINWAGSVYIALATPIYPIVKRKYAKHARIALRSHVIGNLLAVLLISIHFTQQVTRSSANYPDLSTGIILYIATALLVATGMLVISGPGRRYLKLWRFLHPAFALTFYLALVVHVAINV